MVDGEITYSNPFTFNDPFDCDFSDYSHGDEMANLKNKFRVLCLSPKYDDILMWGYYGNSHNGLCVGHTLTDIISSTNRVYKGILIYGNITYESERPDYIYEVPILETRLPYIGVLDKLVQCCFTKFTKWRHESEFRIVTLVDGFDESISWNKNGLLDYINVKANTSIIYKGYKYKNNDSGERINFSNPSIVSALIKDRKDYKLNKR